MTPTRPFPQFGADAFESPRTFVHALLAWNARADAERPHAIMVYDPEVKRGYCIGPYANAYLANDAAVTLADELNSPQVNDGESIQVTILEIQEP